MLSRLHSGNGARNVWKGIAQIQVRASAADSKSQVSAVNPQRDLINFPRPTRLEASPETRFGFIPKAWFDFFYPKTGVTGPYMFMASVSTYLLSKEIYVLNPEFSTAVAYVMMLTFIHMKYGDQIKQTILNKMQECENELNESQESGKQSVRDLIVDLEDSKKQVNCQKFISEAKRENVYLQMEAEYRARIGEVYSRVKKQMDYHLEKDNLERRITQKNLSEWVIDNVMSSITPQQKKDALTQCISQLKSLSAKA